MVKFTDLTKELVEITSCSRQTINLREEDVKAAAQAIKDRNSTIALPRSRFLQLIGRNKEDKTSDHSIAYCINMRLRNPDGPLRRYGLQVGTHTNKGVRMFTFKPVDWNDWDEEHSYASETKEEEKEE